MERDPRIVKVVYLYNLKLWVDGKWVIPYGPCVGLDKDDKLIAASQDGADWIPYETVKDPEELCVPI